MVLLLLRRWCVNSLAFHSVTLTGPFPSEHYFDREAESNDPSFLTQSLNALWSPSVQGVKVV
jgi:hypothetical protein